MPNKALGQHWLKDPAVLSQIADCAEITPSDTVLEIGPGLGTLTSVLLRRSRQVIAVEFDAELAEKLPGQFPGKNLIVTSDDILHYDLKSLPTDYVVVANVPYYITSKIIQKLMTAANKPKIAVLLVQKEVAERITAEPGDMSILAISAQVFAEAELGVEVDRTLFTPPPKVDSQVVILKTRTIPLVAPVDDKHFFRVVKAGFSEKRKKLRSALAGGLSMDKHSVDTLLQKAKIVPEARAQELSIDDWIRLVSMFDLVQ